MIDPVIVWLAAAALSVAALVSYLRRGGRLRLEVAVMLGMLGVAAAGLWLRDRVPWLTGTADAIALIGILAHAYALLLVVGHQRPMPWPIRAAGIVGLVAGAAAVLTTPYPRPWPVALALGGYLLAVEAYAGVVLAFEARRSPGLRRRRLAVAAAGPLFLALAILFATVRDLVPPLAPFFDPAVYPAALVALVGFQLGFLPPRWLRAAWQMREVRRLLEALARMGTDERLDGNAVLLCRAAMGAVGGSDARLVVRENGDWRIVTPGGRQERIAPSGEAVDRVNALLDAGRPLALPPGPRLDSTAAGWARALGAQIVLSVPVVSPERRWGLLLVALRGTPLFLEDDLELVNLLCDQIAMRLDADAYLQVQHRLLGQIASVNAELDQFATVVSHDLQEPLRMVSSYLQLIGRRYGDALGEDGRAFLDYAHSGAERMRQLILDLLTYARTWTEALDVRPVDLSRVLARVTADMRPAIEAEDATITHEALPTVRAFEPHMVQLFQNLIGNALKFAGDAPLRIHVTARETDGHVEITVRDNGVGIDPRYAELIFGVFQRVPGRDVPGTGIGLAICRRIVDRHGGRIHAEPGEGGGTVIRFTLARRPDEGGIWEIDGTSSDGGRLPRNGRRPNGTTAPPPPH